MLFTLLDRHSCICTNLLACQGGYAWQDLSHASWRYLGYRKSGSVSGKSSDSRAANCIKVALVCGLLSEQWREMYKIFTSLFIYGQRVKKYNGKRRLCWESICCFQCDNGYRIILVRHISSAASVVAIIVKAFYDACLVSLSVKNNVAIYFYTKPSQNKQSENAPRPSRTVSLNGTWLQVRLFVDY